MEHRCRCECEQTCLLKNVVTDLTREKKLKNNIVLMYDLFILLVDSHSLVARCCVLSASANVDDDCTNNERGGVFACIRINYSSAFSPSPTVSNAPRAIVSYLPASLLTTLLCALLHIR